MPIATIEDLHERQEKMTDDQRGIFNEITVSLEHTEQHRNGTCECEEYEPLFMFVSGPAGSNFKHEAIFSLRTNSSKVVQSMLIIFAIYLPLSLHNFTLIGTGKSFLIDILRDYVNLHYDSENEWTVAVLAPTGLCQYRKSTKRASWGRHQKMTKISGK